MLDDLISRQAAIDAYGDWYVEEGSAEGFIGTVKQLLEGLPSAQPVIHCKDCCYYPSIYTDCPMVGYERNENDFCSFAERREDDEKNKN